MGFISPGRYRTLCVRRRDRDISTFSTPGATAAKTNDAGPYSGITTTAANTLRQNAKRTLTMSDNFPVSGNGYLRTITSVCTVRTKTNDTGAHPAITTATANALGKYSMGARTTCFNL